MRVKKTIRGWTGAAVLSATVAAAVFYVGIDSSVDATQSATKAPEGWSAESPRDEIRPAFAFEPNGGPDGKGALRIMADQRDGLAGCWKKTFPIVGGKYYRF